MYSHFEPFYANKMFPCFDQYDLKITLLLLTITVEHWVVIGNEFENGSIPISETEDRLKELHLSL